MSSDIEMTGDNENYQYQQFTGLSGLKDMTLDMSESTAKAKAGHRTFFSNCQLSICVAIWCVAIGAPSYSIVMKQIFFGPKECGEADLYWKHRVPINASTTETHLVSYVKDPLTPVDESNLVWCGFLPATYYSLWPNFIQMIIFTVYQNTGTTIKQAWQGAIGTILAVLNVFFMDLVFPDECDCLVGWIDTLGFIFLVLISGSSENTMKFAMSWHVFFMMTFLNPNASNGYGVFPTGIPYLAWDQYTVGVTITSLAGVLVAIIATVFPPPSLLNYKNVTTDAEDTEKAVNKVWREGIEYFCGSKKFVKRFVLSEAITHLNSTIDKMQSNLANSWWETFDLCGFAKKRMLYNIYDTMLQRMGRVMVAVQDSVVTEDFGPSHINFCNKTHAKMVSLREAAGDLLEKCHKVCADGDVDADEADEIEEAVQVVKESQTELLRVYRTVAHGPEGGVISRDLTNENMFVFALSVWARKIVDCAENILEADEVQDEKGSSCGKTFCEGVISGFVGTWKLPSKSKLMWTIRNFISVSTAFWLGYYLPCPGQDAVLEMEEPDTYANNTCTDTRIAASLFTPYDANMANTLGLLINHYPGSALINNIQRLLGVVMGKVLPMVIQGSLGIFGIHKSGKTVAIAISLFLFTWGTNYMYYSSQHWAVVGVLMAGFGAALLARPMREADFTDYNPNYKELAQVVIAIVFQICIDSLFDWIQDDWPRDMAVKKVAALKETLNSSFGAFFDGDMKTLLEGQKTAQGLLAEAKGLIHECDPQMQLTPGYRSDFKNKLYSDALGQLEMLCSDLTMLVLAVRNWRADRAPKDGNDKSALEDESDDEEDGFRDDDFDPLTYMHGLDAVVGKQGIKEELLHYIDLVLGSLVAMLGHPTESNDFQEASKTQALVELRAEGYTRCDEMYTEINQRPFDKYSRAEQVCEDPHAKVSMAVRSLIRAKAHVGEVMKLMMPYIIL